MSIIEYKGEEGLAIYRDTAVHGKSVILSLSRKNGSRLGGTRLPSMDMTSPR